MKSKLLISILFIFLLIAPASAWILEQHTQEAGIAIEETSSSPITQAIIPYQDYYAACDQLVDISVVYYFTIDSEESDNALDKFFKYLTFDIGKPYRATHSRLACERALEIAGGDPVLQACGYGICSHLTQDSVSHNQGVPGAIRKTKLYNGIVHSIKEIHDKNLWTTQSDWQYSRETLNLAYCTESHTEPGCKIVDYFEQVFIDDPALSQVNIPAMISFFLGQTIPDRGYSLGFQAFFALPSGVYWFIFILFFASITLFGFSVRRIRDGQRDVGIFFSAVLGLVILGLVSTTIYGLFTGTVWKMWEVVSQYIFSPALYAIGVLFVAIGGYFAYSWVTKESKFKNINVLAVALFVLLLGGFMLTLPTGLTTGNEQQLHELSINGVKQLLTQGAVYIKTIQDPVGFEALKAANEAGSGVRTFYILTLLSLLVIIFATSFRRKK